MLTNPIAALARCSWQLSSSQLTTACLTAWPRSIGCLSCVCCITASPQVRRCCASQMEAKEGACCQTAGLVASQRHLFRGQPHAALPSLDQTAAGQHKGWSTICRRRSKQKKKMKKLCGNAAQVSGLQAVASPLCVADQSEKREVPCKASYHVGAVAAHYEACTIDCASLKFWPTSKRYTFCNVSARADQL